MEHGLVRAKLCLPQCCTLPLDAILKANFSRFRRHVPGASQHFPEIAKAPSTALLLPGPSEPLNETPEPPLAAHPPSQGFTFREVSRSESLITADLPRAQDHVKLCADPPEGERRQNS